MENSWGRRGCDELRVAWKIHFTICKTVSQWEFVVWCKELSSALCHNLEGEDREGGRFTSEETYTYLWLIHADVWQKPRQHCKAIILQLKKKSIRSNKKNWPSPWKVSKVIKQEVANSTKEQNKYLNSVVYMMHVCSALSDSLKPHGL